LVLDIFVKFLEERQTAIYRRGFEEEVSQLPGAVILVLELVV
jgi:hypothetical protein